MNCRFAAVRLDIGYVKGRFMGFVQEMVGKAVQIG